MQLTKQDLDILKILQRDASLSTGEIAQQLNMSQSPCWRRIHKLEQDGLIHGRVALLNRAALGMDIVVFSTINLTSSGRQNLESFESDIKRHPEVVECYTMTGIWDYMLKIVTRDIRHYEDFVRNTLTTSPAIRELHSHMAVTEIKNTTQLPLDTQL
ncbi:Lrp/AsnC family transcriptional regulator [Parahaliea sp. F7430]|uniref:Lrp/AsnC family transcriptional regulator n=1 Tax=Sediminihaliea albiluteola TaxID=2758564 RepID=A0A7W2TVN0_9GAMM|nr:Lrp/AsnC family transcriptional regulator [Sediminihaliea albiluteola]MBA6412801.1 Lrp/AsnC family transcriptional regulator [Sediminihaliea albiluteola]